MKLESRSFLVLVLAIFVMGGSALAYAQATQHLIFGSNVGFSYQLDGTAIAMLGPGCSGSSARPCTKATEICNVFDAGVCIEMHHGTNPYRIMSEQQQADGSVVRVEVGDLTIVWSGEQISPGALAF